MGGGLSGVDGAGGGVCYIGAAAGVSCVGGGFASYIDAKIAAYKSSASEPP